jgi:hypothetical protein
MPLRSYFPRKQADMAIISDRFDNSFEDILCIDNNMTLNEFAFGNSYDAFQDPGRIWGIEGFATEFP